MIKKSREERWCHNLHSAKYSSIITWIDVICLYIEKEQSTDPCYIMDKPQKHYTKWKKQIIRDQMMYDHIYLKYQK